MYCGLGRCRAQMARWSQVLPIRLVSLMTLATAWGADALAGPREQAYQIFSRLNSVPPSEQTLASMTAKIEAGRVEEAAREAINAEGGQFYGVTLVDMVSRWTNVDKVSRVPLNDYTATIIGMVRDDVPFNTVLSGDVVYVGDRMKFPQFAPYRFDSNQHYVDLEEAIETGGTTLKDALVRQMQSTQTGALPAEAIAGVQSTRGFGQAYFRAGTNRRAVKFVMSTFLCRELEQLADSSRSDFRVRRDVSRTPGGDPRAYRNKCASCHAGMDAFAGAYAYYDMIPGKTADSDKLSYSGDEVAKKFNQNIELFPSGYVTLNNSWVNNWAEGQNADIGWHPVPGGDTQSALGGMGARAFGEMLMATDAFSSCMAERSFTAMCLHKPKGDKDQQIMERLTADFRKDYNLKNAMITAVVACSAK